VARGDSLLTRDAFLEMIEMERIMMSLTEWTDTTEDDKQVVSRPKEAKEVSFIDFCNVQYITLSDVAKT